MRPLVLTMLSLMLSRPAALRGLRPITRATPSLHRPAVRNLRLATTAGALGGPAAAARARPLMCAASVPGAPRWAQSATAATAAFDTAATPAHEPSGTVVEAEVYQVTTVAEAEEVVKVLLALPESTFHACDTEVSGLNLDKSPIGQGTVICVSVYSGPDVDYGRGPGQALWVDTTDLAVLEVLRPFLESRRCAKVWHNYGFDRHVIWNHGIDVKGFGGDTMHMARLWDASRKEGYSLAVLTDELTGRAKTPMKELFGRPVLKKDGSPGRKVELPPVEELQTSPMTRDDWIGYSVYDAQGTWLLHERLKGFLEETEWSAGKLQGGAAGGSAPPLSLYDFYAKCAREQGSHSRRGLLSTAGVFRVGTGAPSASCSPTSSERASGSMRRRSTAAADLPSLPSAPKAEGPASRPARRPNAGCPRRSGAPSRCGRCASSSSVGGPRASRRRRGS